MDTRGEADVGRDDSLMRDDALGGIDDEDEGVKLNLSKMVVECVRVGPKEWCVNVRMWHKEKWFHQRLHFLAM